MTDSIAHSSPALLVVVVDDNGAARLEHLPTASAAGDVIGRLVGGLFDVVHISHSPGFADDALVPPTGLDVWVNDEGLYRCLANPVAAVMAHAMGGDGRPLWGPAVFTGAPDAGGNITGLDAAQADTLQALAREVAGQAEILERARMRHERLERQYR